MEERIIKKLMDSVRCSHCGQNYQGQHVKILGHNHSLWFLSVYCPTCKSQYLLAATVSREKADVISDLSPAEFNRFKNSCAPTANDVLDMHSFLKDFNGDFGRLFGRERVS